MAPLLAAVVVAVAVEVLDGVQVEVALRLVAQVGVVGEAVILIPQVAQVAQLFRVTPGGLVLLPLPVPGGLLQAIALRRL
jgi:hypothetical protein